MSQILQRLFIVLLAPAACLAIAAGLYHAQATTAPATISAPATQTAAAPTTTSTEASPQPRRPFEYVEIVEELDGKPIHGWLARVDLTDPRVEIRVTGPIEREPNDPAATEVRAETTPDWMKREGCVLAINTHFFARVDGVKEGVKPGVPLDLVGPCISEGRVVSPGAKDKPAPVLALTRDRRARIGMFTADDLEGVDDAVCGVPPPKGGEGGLLVTDGRNTGATAAPGPQQRHPRTAAGLTRDRRTLILAVVDGRQPEWSVGMTLPELADLLIRHEAYVALNLDGGGSSSFVVLRPGEEPVTNRPSDGHWRAVGASLGVYVREK